MTRSMSDFGENSLILIVPFEPLTSLGVYWPGPGRDLDLEIVHSSSVYVKHNQKVPFKKKRGESPHRIKTEGVYIEHVRKSSRKKSKVSKGKKG